MNAKDRRFSEGNLLKLRSSYKKKKKKGDEIIDTAEKRNWGGFNASKEDKREREC